MKNSRKRSSPHKGTPSKRFKSQEFVNTEDESSSDGEQVKKKELKQTKLFKKTKKETKANSRYGLRNHLCSGSQHRVHGIHGILLGVPAEEGWDPLI